MADYMTFNEQNYLCHYGIKGMKWGIRRYQNPDGSLTAEGIRRYGDKKGLAKHIQAENKKASQLAGAAAISDRALNRAEKRLAKAEKRLKKAHSAKSAFKRAIDVSNAQESRNELKTKAEANRKAVKEHYDSLIKEFGKEAVANVVYNKKGEISDGVAKGDAIVASALIGGLGGASLAALATAFDKNPVSPKTGIRSSAKRLEKETYKANRLKL